MKQTDSNIANNFFSPVLHHMWIILRFNYICKETLRELQRHLQNNRNRKSRAHKQNQHVRLFNSTTGFKGPNLTQLTRRLCVLIIQEKKTKLAIYEFFSQVSAVRMLILLINTQVASQNPPPHTIDDWYNVSSRGSAGKMVKTALSSIYSA